MSELGLNQVPDFRMQLVEDGVAPTAETRQRQILEALQTQEDPLEFLDSLSPLEKVLAVDGLARLSLVNALELYGDQALVWAYLASTKTGHTERLEKTLRWSANYSITLLKKARHWAKTEMVNGTGRDAMAQYAFMKLLMDDMLKTLDISPALQSSALEGVELSDERRARYSLRPLISNPYREQATGSVELWEIPTPDGEIVDYPIHLDAPTGVALLYKNVPQAVLGLSVLGGNEVMIHQIQGIRGTRLSPDTHAKNRIIGKTSARGLAPFDWKKLMVDIAEEIAKTAGMERVGIQQAKQNEWVQYKHLPSHQAKSIYDETAKRMGFERGRDGNWHKAIT